MRLSIGAMAIVVLGVWGWIANASHTTTPHPTATASVKLGPTYILPPQLQGWRLFVTDLNDGEVADIGRATLRLGGSPHGLAVAPDGSLWVTNAGGTKAWLLSPRGSGAATPIGSAEAGPGPVHIAFSPDGTRAYVTDFAGAALTVIDTKTLQVVDSITTPAGPHAIAIAPDGHELYVACPTGGAFIVVDPAASKVSATIALPSGAVPYGLALAPDGKTVYVSDVTFGRLYAVDVATRQVRGSVQVGARPALVAWVSHTTRLIVANNGSGTVTIVDTATLSVVATIPTGAGPHGVAASPDGRYAFAANTGANTVSVIDLQTLRVIAQIAVGRFPNDVVVLPAS